MNVIPLPYIFNDLFPHCRPTRRQMRLKLSSTFSRHCARDLNTSITYTCIQQQSKNIHIYICIDPHTHTHMWKGPFPHVFEESGSLSHELSSKLFGKALSKGFQGNKLTINSNSAPSFLWTPSSGRDAGVGRCGGFDSHRMKIRQTRNFSLNGQNHIQKVLSQPPW